MKGVICIHNDKIWSNGVKGGSWVHNTRNQVKLFRKESIGYTMIQCCQMVLKGVNWVHYNKMMSNGLERSQ